MLLTQDGRGTLRGRIWTGTDWGGSGFEELESDTGEEKNQPFTFVWD